jgi:hypothetical protein
MVTGQQSLALHGGTIHKQPLLTLALPRQRIAGVVSIQGCCAPIYMPSWAA